MKMTVEVLEVTNRRRTWWKSLWNREIPENAVELMLKEARGEAEGHFWHHRGEEEQGSWEEGLGRVFGCRFRILCGEERESLKPRSAEGFLHLEIDQFIRDSRNKNLTTPAD